MAEAAPPASGPDAWDMERAGLLDGAALDLLKEVHTVHDGPRAPDGATAYLVGEPRYIPYRATVMPCPDEGLMMAEHILRTVYRPEIIHSVETGAVADIARRTTAVQAAGLWRKGETPAGRGLEELARRAPRKGGETGELWAEYQRRVPSAADPIIAMRDMWGSVYSWQFIRGDDARLHDLSASLLSITTAVDFCGALDDSRAGNQHRYMVTSGEGLAHLSGPAATLAAREMVAVGALMVARDAIATTPSTDVQPPTPEEYMGARCWDGAVAPYYRVMLGTSHYLQVGARCGEFTARADCTAIQRAIDNIVRYNDVTDAVADYVSHESFNELLLVLAVVGPESVTGYGTALAEATDAALACTCSAPGHEEAGELSMGACVFYLLTPRYQVRRQLSAFTNTTAGTAFTARASGCLLLPGSTFHDDTWAPLWQPAPPPTVDERAHRIARRSTIPGVDTSACTTAAAAALACDLPSADVWQQVFDTALAASGDVDKADAAPLRDLLRPFWQQAVLGEATTHGTDARLLMDTDQAIRATYRLPATTGLHLRRAFFGVASGAAELAHTNPYARLADGLAATCR
ncbi:hypothetical protein C9F11_45300 (plasmid) [Streptomyces sp. YIM 121038]|uniref:hypothetical protein n=1 Tax=Streptomyces sp. YIM 121038 TaxID=2136401 RepID=UPI0011106D64|nr:hypothetical protein [Streptomyces sp. YIM 121038]QCX82620.1 hypothetical protein C9F11_45300 [Streptomyces sp. YIM 121038]